MSELQARAKNNPTPANVKAAEQAQAYDLVVFLVNGDFKVHSKGCKSLYRDRRRAGNEFEQTGTTQYETVADLWSDIIAERDIGQYPTEHDAIISYFDNTHFHSCLDMPEGIPTPAEGSGNRNSPTPGIKRASKRLLAKYVVDAAADMLAKLADEDPVFAGMDAEDAAKFVSHWLHHLPVNHDAWPAALPKPDRSDWR